MFGTFRFVARQTTRGARLELDKWQANAFRESNSMSRVMCARTVTTFLFLNSNLI